MKVTEIPTGTSERTMIAYAAINHLKWSIHDIKMAIKLCETIDLDVAELKQVYDIVCSKRAEMLEKFGSKKEVQE